MNSQITVSQKSVEKQLLVNNLRLIPELINIVKDFAFYDKVSEVSRNLKNVLIAGLDESFEPGSGIGHQSTEGTGILGNAEMPYIRYRHTAIQLPEFLYHNFQFVACYTCGGYIMTNTILSSQDVICRCGVTDFIDDDEVIESSI